MSCAGRGQGREASATVDCPPGLFCFGGDYSKASQKELGEPVLERGITGVIDLPALEHLYPVRPSVVFGIRSAARMRRAIAELAAAVVFAADAIVAIPEGFPAGT